jgi:hypothetical protein
VLLLGPALPTQSDGAPRAVNAELTQLLARFEPVAPAPDDCGARDWSDLDQRMDYIVQMF